MPKILFANEDIVVCVKPAGMLSQKNQNKEDSLIEWLSEQLGGTIYPVHRLDRETSGVMVYARNTVSAAELSQQIQTNSMQKQYLAVVHGLLAVETTVLEDLLLHDKRTNKSYVVNRMRKGVRDAKLAYHILATCETRTLVQIKLFTGRTHQIRVQFASRKHPLVGDRRYGGGSGTLCLVSSVLEFRMPKTNEPMTYTYVPEQLDCFQNIELIKMNA